MTHWLYRYELDRGFIFGITTFDASGKPDREEQERKRGLAGQILEQDPEKDARASEEFRDRYTWEPDAKIMEMILNASTVLGIQKLEKREVDKALDRLEEQG
jgi:hypothetical protein